MGRLTQHSIRRLSPGKHADGAGLYLFVTDAPAETWSWRFIFSLNGRRPTLSLGKLRDLGLAEARAEAAKARALVRQGVNPIDARKAAKKAANRTTFGQVADEWFETKAKEFRNEKYLRMVQRDIDVVLGPLRRVPVADVNREHVLQVLQPVWTKTPETGKRLRERVEAILDSAIARELRTDSNPARWKGHLEHLLQKPKRIEKSHHAAMKYTEVPQFIQRLRELETISSLALQFTILTASRSGETYGALWSEIDLGEKVWVIPAARMKAGRLHRVPLSDAAIDVLGKARWFKRDDFVFPGQRRGKSLSHIAMPKVLERLNIANATVHGFRSSFRDFAGNETNVPREVCEAGLAHAVGDSAEQAYRRDDALDKRRTLMSMWADYLSGGNVVSFKKKQA